MEIKEIINSLVNLDNGLLCDIDDQIKSIKKKREENRLHELVNKLNKLLEPIAELLDGLDEDLLRATTEIEHFTFNKFNVGKDVDGHYIDFD